MDFNNLKPRLLNLDTPHICDTSDKVKVFNHHLRPLLPNLKMVGIAHTVDAENDLLIVLKALQEIQTSEILVINSNGAEKAMFGEIITTDAKARGVAGIVCDGVYRDTAMLRKIGLPIYARHSAPNVVTKSKPGKTQIPIQCGGITVNPGDIIIGDDDGVIAIHPQDLLTTLTDAEKLRDHEIKVLKHIKDGKHLTDLFINFEEYYREISNGKSAKLQWKDL